MNQRKAIVMISMLAIAVILSGLLIPVYSSNFFERSNGNGYDVPRDGECPHKGPQGPWMDELTEDQRAEIHDLIEEMQDAGADKEEIREAVNAKLGQWGIEVPDPEFQGPRGPWMDELTEDQRAEIHDLIEEMQDAGADKEEIREAVQQLLEE